MSAGALTIALVQADTVWHDAQANRNHSERLLRAAPRFGGPSAAADLIVLPETFTTGFSNEALATAETMDGATVAWLRAQAQSLGAAITGSVQIREGAEVFNRLLWAMPDGTVHHYDKRHLFRMAGEHERYSAGRDPIFVDLKGWRICPLVCYDLRFPVYSRNRFDVSRARDLDYDLLLYVANWPSARQSAWDTLLRARAIENLSYVVGVNRVGIDGNGVHYTGGSVVLDPLGVSVAECGDSVAVVTATLSLEQLREQRKRFPAYLDADPFELYPD